MKGAPGLTVQSRLSGSPAELADLSAGDEIIAPNGLRMDGQKLAFYIANRSPAPRSRSLSAREGVMRETQGASDGAGPAFEFRMQKKHGATAEEKRTLPLVDARQTGTHPWCTRTTGPRQRGRSAWTIF